jgi:hypothetical protein
MATGEAWNLDDPKKPWAYFDPNAVRDVPYEWDVWLSDIESTYASHTVSAAPGLTIPSSVQSGGVIKIRIKKDPLLPLVVGQLYGVTCHIVAADGQEEDQTLYFKIIEK